MNRFHSFQTALQLAIGTVLLALVLQVFFVMGLVVPVQVAGSSMAPTLRGPHVVAKCTQCDTTFEVGAEFAAETSFGNCPHCGDNQVPLDGLAIHSADRLWIDRTAFERRSPRRGEVVVAQNPADGSQLCVKRVIGLPGEMVELRQGDVWIDGRPWVKNLAEQRTVRQLVLRDDVPITDDFAYNAGVSRMPQLVRDVMLSARIEVHGKGTLTIDLQDGRQMVQVTLAWPAGELNVNADGNPLIATTLSATSQRRLGAGPVLLELSNFDRNLLLAIDSRVELSYPLEVNVPHPAGTERPFTVDLSGPDFNLSELAVYHDFYYSRQAVGVMVGKESVILGDGEYYLLGDNSPISIDSRSWGGVPRRFLVGRPLGVR